MSTTPTLTFRQERFVLEYLKDQNASAAAARAGYTAQNMASQGNELMSNPAVRERVRREMQDLLAELRVSALELMKQRARAAFFRCDRLFREGWEPLTLQELDEETLKALEVTTVLRKSGLVTRVKQPCRDKALRALERVHERMDKLNEQYWAKLEKEGLVPSLEEIDAMDGGGVEAQTPAIDTSEKHQVLSGLMADAQCRTASFDRLRTNGEVGGMVNGVARGTVYGVADVSANFPDKPQVLSGLGKGANSGAREFPEKHQVLSGSGEGANTGAREFPEKHQVLSGSGEGAETGACEISEKHQVLSGSQAAKERPPVRWPAELLAQLPIERGGTGRRRGVVAA